MEICTDSTLTAACLEIGWGFWVKTGALVTSAASFLVGAASLVITSRHAKQRATVDLIIKQRDDPEYLRCYRRVLQIHEENPRATDFSWLLNRQSVDKEAFSKVLNEQELIAVGIRERAFDEKIYKEMQYSSVVKLWKASDGMIGYLQQKTGNPNIYRDFVALAKKWDADPLRPLPMTANR